MSGKPLDPQPSHQPASGSGTPESTPRHAHDRTGTLDIERHVKDDGRALIIYRHVDDAAAGTAERG